MISGANTARFLNFRDFGGIPTREGRSVREGMLFRSGHLCGLQDAAVAELLDRRFGLIVDLRYDRERAERPSPWPETMDDRIVAHDAPNGTDAPHLEAMQTAMREGGDIAVAYRSLYAALPFDRWYWPLFARAVQRIAEADGPVLIHCSAGKDRTGLLAAMVLALLEVPQDAIIADYLATNGAAGMETLRDDMKRRAVTNRLPLAEAQIDQICGVDGSYLEAAFTAIQERFGTLRDYLIAGGLPPRTAEALKDRYLA